MAYTRIKMEGVAELKAALEDLGTEVGTKVGVAANRRAAIVGRDRLVAAAPIAERQSPGSKRYGRLRGNIRVRKVSAGRATRVRHVIDTGKAFWARFVEFGTAKAAARPFWRPTIDGAHAELFGAQLDELRTGVDQAARKAARLGKRKGG